MKTKLIQIERAIKDEKLYPRNLVDWITVLRYKQSMQVGADFPPIIVASFKGKYIVVDGFHRLQARKDLKETHIQVEILEGLNKKGIYLESIKRNVSHGRQFSGQERARILLTLKKWKMSQQKISEIVQLPVDKIEPFLAKKIVRISETQEIVPLKFPISHLAGSEISGVDGQVVFAGRGQIQILDSMIVLLENGWLNMDSELVKEKVDKIKDLLI